MELHRSAALFSGGRGMYMHFNYDRKGSGFLLLRAVLRNYRDDVWKLWAQYGFTSTHSLACFNFI